MSNIQQRIAEFKDALGIKNQSVFAEKLDINRTTLIGYENGSSPPSAEFLIKIRKIYNINIEWLLFGNGEMLVAPKREEKHPLISNLEALIDQRLEKIETEIAEIKGRFTRSNTDSLDSGMFVSEPEPEYDTARVCSVDNVAAGPPIPQSEDLSNFIEVPRRLIKTKPEDYYAAHIQGQSMTAAGIPDGCRVLIRKSDVPRNGAIQVVRCGGRSTLKRLREHEDHRWTLNYEDDTGRFIEVGLDEDYQVQGDFIAVLPDVK